jgi:hypothetical protein
MAQLVPATSVAPIGPVRVATTPWRYRGELQLSVLVKLQLRMRNNAAMELMEAPPLVLRDRHHDGDPTRSLAEASDLVPYRAMADVWLTGRAYAPLGRSVRALVARLGLFRQGTPLLEKTVHLVGKRERSEDEPEPFESMQLLYERAYGGAGFDANPVGVGACERACANILDPVDPLRPAGFGPVPRYWRARRRDLSAELRRELEQPIPDIPAGFDWAYLQAAPEDQRVPFLQGDEWLVLDGMHPMFMRMQSRLPSVIAAARVLPLEPNSELGDAVALVADTLAIDTEAETCCLSWRGVIPVASEAALSNMLVAGAALRRDESIDWGMAYGAEQTLAMESKREGLSLDRSGVTVVSEAPAPAGVMDELRFDTIVEEVGENPTGRYRRVTERELGQTRSRAYPTAEPDEETTGVDVRAPKSPASVTKQSAVPSFVIPDDHAAWSGVDDEREVRVRGRIPLVVDTDWSDETAPGRIPLGADSDTELTAPGRAPVPLDSDFAAATLPGRGGSADTDPGPEEGSDEDMPWVHETAVEPLPRPRDPAMSMPPAPLDKQELAASLRLAGASEQEIAAILQSFDDRKPG